MFPMISEVAEFDAAKAIVERELTYLRQHGHALPERIDIGTMVEVPALKALPDGRTLKEGRLRLGRLQRSVPVCSRSTVATPKCRSADTMSARSCALRDIVRKANAAKKGVSLRRWPCRRRWR
jgi:phosphotransferase system enzyme I (PtsP)